MYWHRAHCCTAIHITTPTPPREKVPSRSGENKIGLATCCINLHLAGTAAGPCAHWSTVQSRSAPPRASPGAEERGGGGTGAWLACYVVLCCVVLCCARLCVCLCLCVFFVVWQCLTITAICLSRRLITTSQQHTQYKILERNAYNVAPSLPYPSHQQHRPQRQAAFLLPSPVPAAAAAAAPARARTSGGGEKARTREGEERDGSYLFLIQFFVLQGLGGRG